MLHMFQHVATLGMLQLEAAPPVWLQFSQGFSWTTGVPAIGSIADLTVRLLYGGSDGAAGAYPSPPGRSGNVSGRSHPLRSGISIPTGRGRLLAPGGGGGGSNFTGPEPVFIVRYWQVALSIPEAALFLYFVLLVAAVLTTIVALEVVLRLLLLVQCIRQPAGRLARRITRGLSKADGADPRSRKGRRALRRRDDTAFDDAGSGAHGGDLDSDAMMLPLLLRSLHVRFLTLAYFAGSVLIIARVDRVDEATSDGNASAAWYLSMFAATWYCAGFVVFEAFALRGIARNARRHRGMRADDASYVELTASVTDVHEARTAVPRSAWYRLTRPCETRNEPDDWASLGSKTDSTRAADTRIALVHGSLFTHFVPSCWAFFVVAFTARLSEAGITVILRSHPTVQLVALIAIQVAMCLATLLVDPYRAKRTKLVHLALYTVKAANFSMCFAFLPEVDASTSVRDRVALVSLALHWSWIGFYCCVQLWVLGRRAVRACQRRRRDE